MKFFGNDTAWIIIVSLAMLVTNAPVKAQAIHGRVISQDSLAISDVTVSISSIGKTTSTDIDGKFSFEKVSPGSYILQFTRIGYDSTSMTVTVSNKGVVTPLLVVMKTNFIALNSVTVTAQPQPMKISNSSQSVSVLNGSYLSANAGSSPSSALSNLPGVSLVHSGDFSEKPEIRGLGYQRVVILEDGVRHEYQSWDDDDSPGIDALSLTRIEIVRGPNSVLYGSDALGGVVNYIHNDGTLKSVDTSAMQGELIFQGMSNNTEGAIHGDLEGLTSLGEYNLSITARGAGNIVTPYGSLANTGASELNFGASGSTQRDWGSILVGYSHFDQHRDILPASNDDDPPDSGESDTPYQSTIHDRAWLSYKAPPAPTGLAVDLVLQQNAAAEYESDDPSSIDNSLRHRAESIDAKYNYDEPENNIATVGFSIMTVQLATLGPEPVIPAYHQTSGAVFIYDDYRIQDVDLSAGGRFDRRYLNVYNNADLDLTSQSRSFHAYTGSFGVLWHTTQDLALGMDVGSGWRAPEVEELFINGSMEGALEYKEGDPNLLPEQSFSTDLIARLTGESISGEISAYYNRISRYIYLGPTGRIDSASGYPIYMDQQANATLIGVDARLNFDIATRTTLTLGGDFIQARNNDENTWLPLTPANRISVALRYVFLSSSLISEPYIEGTSDIILDQNKVAPDETQTGGYTVFDLHFGGHVFAFDRPLTMDCQIHNLLNRTYYDNMSLYRLYAAEPGIDFRFTVTVPFVVLR